jgi:signal transduction histidine kinase/ligand-binding sensor domain-containing protein
MFVFSNKNIVQSALFIVILFFVSISESYTQNKVLRFEHLTVENGLSQNTIHGILEDKYGFMWFGTWAGLCKYDGFKFTIYRSDPDNPKALINNRIHYIYADSVADIWIASFDSTYLCRYNYETDDFTRVLRKNVPRWLRDSLTRRLNYKRTHILKNNILWEVDRTNYLLYQTDLNTGKKIAYRADIFNPWALNDEYITDLYLSHDDILWVGTFNGGINKADLNAKPFHFYYHSPLDENTLPSNLIRAICEDHDGNLWIGTRNDGLSKLDRETNKYTHYRHDEKNSNSLVSNQIRKIFADSYGFIWIGTKGGLSKYDPQKNRFENFMMDSKDRPIPHRWVYWIMEDHNKNLWIGTWRGIAKYNRSKNSFFVYDYKETLVYPNVRVIVEDKDYNLWVATEGGGLTKLTRMDTSNFEEKFKPTHFVNSPSDSNSLINDRIYSLLYDDDGIFWIGTGGGLSRFDPMKKKFTRFTSKKGLPDELIMGILSDKKSIWISHKKGITQLNKKDYKMQHYTKKDGLLGDEFSEDAYYKSSKGEMFFGGLNGLNSFFPDRIRKDLNYPQIVFTDLYILNNHININEKFNGRVVLNKALYLTDIITLNHLDKSFRIEFAALRLIDPDRNIYKYKLDGFDKEWINLNGGSHYVAYSNLKPKTYILKVMAANSDGVWNPEPIALTIKVLPPWWASWWFKILMVIIGILSVIFFIYLRTSLYRIREKELKKLVQQRTIELETSNELLVERQYHIEQQAAELQVQTENLMETNELLMEKQALISAQTEILEETNKQLSLLNATKDKLFSIIAHDLRNPFHTVMGFSELLITSFEKLPVEKTKKYLHLIHTSSTGGNILLENLLQWSRSQTGKINFEPEVLDLSDVANQVAIFLEIDAHRKNIVIHNLIETGTFVYADPNMLLTIIRNLISNAIKFTGENGEIKVLSLNDTHFVEISVADNGVGISENDQLNLFDINKNISTKGTNEEKGTGLGLILCKEFVERHNGKIWVESAPGKGSKFKFTIPVSK